MQKVALIVVGLIVAAVGLLWALQGLNVLGGSAMSGKTLWAVVGPILVVVGLVIAAIGLRRPA